MAGLDEWLLKVVCFRKCGVDLFRGDQSYMKKKPLVIVVACFLAAVCVFVMTRKKDTGINSIKGGVQVWTKCASEDCGEEVQMEKREYYARVQEKRKLQPRSTMNVPIDCQQCGEESVFLAVECDECEHIFFKASAGGEYGDQCPECGYSAIEEKIANR